MKKLHAFTLLELLIGMIIGCVVMGICYTGYSAIHEQFNQYKNVQKEITTTFQFYSVFNNDFVNCGEASFVSEKIVLSNRDSSTIEYTIYDQFIIRSTNTVHDTFYIAPINVSKTFFYGDENTESNLLTQFSFDAQVLDEQEHFAFIKQYSADTFLKYSKK